MKTCNTCGEDKSPDDFYKGHAKCKICYRKKVRRYRQENIEKIRAYDRNRGNRLPAGYQQKYREKYPNKYRAHNMVNNAIRDGKLFKEPCCKCGAEDNTHAHHDDYLKPLNVRWLCAACHHQWHANNGEGENP